MSTSVDSFNPRAHTGRDPLDLSIAPILPVSIHAPIRGATEISMYSMPMSLFQSTRPYGARRHTSCLPLPGLCFNPRAHTGRDIMWMPLWNSTEFQSTRPYGARHQRKTGYIGLREFQSTRPYGARPGPFAGPFYFNSFNPRAHTGRDSSCPPDRA